ncbi:unnamed protein product, partial [Discosporangium mesarthrocarpum]
TTATVTVSIKPSPPYCLPTLAVPTQTGLKLQGGGITPRHWIIVRSTSSGAGSDDDSSNQSQGGKQQGQVVPYYYCSGGSGGLPPSWGWRALEAEHMPGPVLGFAAAEAGLGEGQGVATSSGGVNSSDLTGAGGALELGGDNVSSFSAAVMVGDKGEKVRRDRARAEAEGGERANLALTPAPTGSTKACDAGAQAGTTQE